MELTVRVKPGSPSRPAGRGDARGSRGLRHRARARAGGGRRRERGRDRGDRRALRQPRRDVEIVRGLRRGSSVCGSADSDRLQLPAAGPMGRGRLDAVRPRRGEHRAGGRLASSGIRTLRAARRRVRAARRGAAATVRACSVPTSCGRCCSWYPQRAVRNAASSASGASVGTGSPRRVRMRMDGPWGPCRRLRNSSSRPAASSP